VAARTNAMAHTTSPVSAANRAQTNICRMILMEKE
jgi:hypothetical protein